MLGIFPQALCVHVGVCICVCVRASEVLHVDTDSMTRASFGDHVSPEHWCTESCHWLVFGLVIRALQRFRSRKPGAQTGTSAVSDSSSICAGVGSSPALG